MKITIKLFLMLFSFFAKVDFRIFGFFVPLVFQAKSEIYVDGTKGLKRHPGHGLAYANFAAHKFRYLNITPLASVSVKEIRDCGKLCVDHSSCFSANFAAFYHDEERILCELLPSDKYNNSDKFFDSAVFHHLSIKVSSEMVYFSIITKYENMINNTKILMKISCLALPLCICIVNHNPTL